AIRPGSYWPCVRPLSRSHSVPLPLIAVRIVRSCLLLRYQRLEPLLGGVQRPAQLDAREVEDIRRLAAVLAVFPGRPREQAYAGGVSGAVQRIGQAVDAPGHAGPDR